ncbi:hypothetical protein [Methanobrevibacter sp.]
MDITKYPQFELYLLTLNLLTLKDQLVPDGCNPRCINSTIINRAYFSSYLYCLLWLEDVKKFKPIPILQLGPDERISEHQQVRNALSNFGEIRMKSELLKLADLRRKADYDPFSDITSDEVTDAVRHMEKIFNHLKFE